MARSKEADDGTDSIVILAPCLRRARLAARSLEGRWEGKRLVKAFPRAALERSTIPGILLCPEGRELGADVDFLQRARKRFLWPAPDGDLRAAIAGLRGEEPLPVGRIPPAPKGSDRKGALLLEGVVTLERARAALGSPRRHWIVENPLRVLLTEQHLQELAEEGVRWSALQPARVLGLLASPALARARARWRRLLPPRVKVKVLRASKAERKPLDVKRQKK